jgi:hypothetical protein
LPALSLCTCCRHYPGAATGGTTLLIHSRRVSLPQIGCRVGPRIVLFEACSAFTRVAACTLALPPNRGSLNRRLQPFRFLHSCSGASGWSSAPGGIRTHWKAPPYHGARQLQTVSVAPQFSRKQSLKGRRQHWRPSATAMSCRVCGLINAIGRQRGKRRIVAELLITCKIGGWRDQDNVRGRSRTSCRTVTPSCGAPRHRPHRRRTSRAYRIQPLAARLGRAAGRRPCRMCRDGRARLTHGRATRRLSRVRTPCVPRKRPTPPGFPRCGAVGCTSRRVHRDKAPRS